MKSEIKLGVSNIWILYNYTESLHYSHIYLFAGKSVATVHERTRRLKEKAYIKRVVAVWMVGRSARG